MVSPRSWSDPLILEGQNEDVHENLDESNRKAINMNWSNQKVNPTLKTKTGNK